MVTCEWLEEEIRSVVPNCQVEAIDLNGTQDHFHIRIIAESFEGMRPLQRQKLILNHFKPYIPRPIHAIDLKCMTPAQAETAGDTVFHPHAGGTEFTLSEYKNTRIRSDKNGMNPLKNYKQ